jgi:hypothetical protein
VHAPLGSLTSCPWMKDLQTVTLVGVILDTVGDEGDVLAITSIVQADTVLLVGRRDKLKIKMEVERRFTKSMMVKSGKYYFALSRDRAKLLNYSTHIQVAFTEVQIALRLEAGRIASFML